MGDDSLDVSGGAGGVAANYADMVSYASMIDTAGDDLRETSGRLADLLTDGDILEAALLCPAEVAEVEAALALAATGPSGALWASGELELSARFLRTSVWAWRELDEQLGRAEDAFWTTAGWGAGAMLPGAGLATLGLLASNPALAALLYANRENLAAGAQETLYDHPWLMEGLTRSAPGVVQGASFSLSQWLPGGTLKLAALTDGQWPTGDYTGSVAGLLAIANQFGHLQDTGRFDVEPVGDPVELAVSRDSAVATIFAEQGELGRNPGQIQIIETGHPPRYVVQIPGTQEWGTQRGDNPVDLTSNLALIAGQDPTVIESQVIAAMKEAGIGPEDEVMLTGHSQGGITAMSLASDAGVQEDFNIRSVVTGGSPVGRFDVSDDVSVLSLEHDQDAVPMLDAADNPDRPNWVTVRRELSDAEGTSPSGERGPGPAHSTTNYEETGASVDASSDPSLQQWREDNAAFFGTGTRTRYQITPGGEG